MHPQGASLVVCGACGVVAPTNGQICEGCKSSLTSVGVRVPLQGDVLWVALRASFTCRSCGFRSPLDGVVLGQGITCAQCNTFQHFDPSVWPSALELAHAVGDLGGQDPEGRFPHPELWIGDTNPHRAIGQTETFAVHIEAGFQVEMSPGFPVCTDCKVPCELHPAGRDLSTRCPRCEKVSRYTLPAELIHSAPTAVAVVADEQRQGHTEVRVQQSSTGLQVLACPNCGASLEASSARSLVCSFCKTTSFLPAQARTRGPGQLVEPIVFWVAFRGPSPTRTALERPRAPETKLAFSLGRANRPLPGFALAPVRPGVDVTQLALTIGLTLASLGVGFVVALMADWL